MKFPFSFSLKFAFRLLLPGLFLALGFWPLALAGADAIGTTVNALYILPVMTIVAGWVIVTLDMRIYMIFEGRRYWPPPVRWLCTSLENWRLKRIKRVIKNFRQRDPRKYLEASAEVRSFPMDDSGNYCVWFPSRLGNLIAAFESYSLRVYGMDAVFYWPRIWIRLDKDLREEIDNHQAIADSAVYVSTSLYCCAVFSVAYLALSSVLVDFAKYVPKTSILYFLPFVLVLAGYLLYRGSLPLHAQFGELFKSTFDMARTTPASFEFVLDEIASLTGDDPKSLPHKEQSIIVWRFLNNYRIKQRDTGRNVVPGSLERDAKRKTGGQTDMTSEREGS